jgi:2-methylcitrate dehydratase PrpD
MEAQTQSSATHGADAVTRGLAGWSAKFSSAATTAKADRWARHALLDWFAVTIAGAKEPLAGILAEEFRQSTSGPCTIIASNSKASLHDAALVNGAVSHALDYDDVNRLMHGHPTVPVAASVLALGEMMGKSGRDVLTAFIAGYEVECRLGDMCGDGHYEHGFHATGTMGTFGAAAGAANLLGLDAEKTAMALGIAASEAAGLKINFGTMTRIVSSQLGSQREDLRPATMPSRHRKAFSRRRRRASSRPRYGPIPMPRWRSRRTSSSITRPVI